MQTPFLYFSSIVLVAFVAGCSNWNSAEAPAGFAIIREHMISVPKNDPPIHSTLDFTITEIDGKPVTRESVPPFVDMQPGALVSAGSHEVKALVSPHVRPPDHRPAQVVFKVNVESTKVYYLVGKDGGPALIEAKSALK